MDISVIDRAFARAIGPARITAVPVRQRPRRRGRDGSPARRHPDTSRARAPYSNSRQRGASPRGRPDRVRVVGLEPDSSAPAGRAARRSTARPAAGRIDERVPESPTPRRRAAAWSARLHDGSAAQVRHRDRGRRLRGLPQRAAIPFVRDASIVSSMPSERDRTARAPMSSTVANSAVRTAIVTPPAGSAAPTRARPRDPGTLDQNAEHEPHVSAHPASGVQPTRYPSPRRCRAPAASTRRFVAAQQLPARRVHAIRSDLALRDCRPRRVGARPGSAGAHAATVGGDGLDAQHVVASATRRRRSPWCSASKGTAGLPTAGQLPAASIAASSTPARAGPRARPGRRGPTTYQSVTPPSADAPHRGEVSRERTGMRAAIQPGARQRELGAERLQRDARALLQVRGFGLHPRDRLRRQASATAAPPLNVTITAIAISSSTRLKPPARRHHEAAPMRGLAIVTIRTSVPAGHRLDAHGDGERAAA